MHGIGFLQDIGIIKHNKLMGLRGLIDFLKSFFLDDNVIDHDFKQEYWRDISKRKYYIRFIIENPKYKGKSKTAIEAYFGNNECKHLYVDRWTYYVQTKGKREYMLAFYFEDNILIDIKYEYKRI